MTERPLNPVEVEAAIVSAANEVAEGIGEASRLYNQYTVAKHQFDQAWASAYLGSTGPVEERKQRCIMATDVEAEKLRVAEVSWKYAKSRLDAAEARLSAYQSLMKSVLAAYNVAGAGAY